MLCTCNDATNRGLVDTEPLSKVVQKHDELINGLQGMACRSALAESSSLSLPHADHK
jgi:hypothetical protein